MILKNNSVNDFKKFDNDYMKLTDFENIKALEIMIYLSVSRIGLSLNPASEDFKYKKKTEGEITLVNAECCHDDYKKYTILLRGNYLFGGFDNDKVYLIAEENILSINDGNLEHYRIYSGGLKLINSFSVDVKSLCMKGFFKKGIIINGRIYDIEHGAYTTPEFDEIISWMDYKKEGSIIYDESICPKELRIALQNVVENGDVSLGIKQVIADEPLIDLEKEEYIKTIVICVIDKFNNCMDDYFYYDSVNNKIMSKKKNKSADITSEVKKELNSITDFLNRKKAKELENSLYVDATRKISSILPEESRKKLESKNIFKKYKNNN